MLDTIQCLGRNAKFMNHTEIFNSFTEVNGQVQYLAKKLAPTLSLAAFKQEWIFRFCKIIPYFRYSVFSLEMLFKLL